MLSRVFGVVCPRDVIRAHWVVVTTGVLSGTLTLVYAYTMGTVGELRAIAKSTCVHRDAMTTSIPNLHSLLLYAGGVPPISSHSPPAARSGARSVKVLAIIGPYVSWSAGTPLPGTPGLEL